MVRNSPPNDKQAEQKDEVQCKMCRKHGSEIDGQKNGETRQCTRRLSNRESHGSYHDVAAERSLSRARFDSFGKTNFVTVFPPSSIQ